MRRSQVDAGSQPVRNLVTFPGFEVASGTTAVRQNLFTNPGFETGSGTINVRTNLAMYPRTTVSTFTNWGLSGYGSGGAGTYLNTSGAGMDGGYAGVATWTTAGGAGTGASIVYGGAGDALVTAGQTYTLSAYAKTNQTITAGYVRGNWIDAAGATISQFGQTVTYTANVWTRISQVGVVAPANAVRVTLEARIQDLTGTTSGLTFTADKMLIEATPVLGTYFDGATPISNLVTNPSFETDTTGWTGKGTTPPTFALDTSIVQAGTKSLKATAQATTPSGVGINVSGLIVGVKYTMSGSVYVPAGNANVVSTISGIGYGTQTSTKDVWTRLSMTFIATATTHQVGFDFSSQAVGSIFYLDAVMLNVGDTALPYIEGNGDFTYVWSGTANASTSIQQAPGIAGMGLNIQGGNAAASKIYQTLIGQKTKGMKVYKAGGYVFFDLTVTGLQSNTTYTFSYDVLTDRSTINTVDRGTAAAPIYAPADRTVTPNVWTRINRQFTTGASDTTRVLSLGGWENATVPDGSTATFDNLVIEQGAISTPYFDGATAAAGDFTYAWNGAANASISEERAPTVSGMSGNYSSRVAWQSGDWSASGTKSLAVAGSRPYIDCFSQFNNAAIFGSAPLANRTFTFMARLRTLEAYPAGADGRAWSFHTTWNRSGGGTSSLNCKPVTTYAGVHEVRQTFTFPSDATTVSFMRFYNGSPNNSTVYWDNAMVVEGTYTGDFINPSQNAFSKWDGTANASTSIGYPPQLLDIAGVPMASTYAESTSLIPISGGAFDDCTVYVAYEAYAEIAEWTTIASVGGWSGASPDWAGKGAFSFGRRNAGNLQFSHTRTGTTANSNQSGMGTSVVVGWKPSRHVVAISLTDGVNNMRTMMDGAAEQGFALSPGNGIAREFIKMRSGASTTEGAASTGAKGLALLYYPGYHSFATRQAMIRYLGNKYGANVA